MQGRRRRREVEREKVSPVFIFTHCVLFMPLLLLLLFASFFSQLCKKKKKKKKKHQINFFLKRLLLDKSQRGPCPFGTLLQAPELRASPSVFPAVAAAADASPCCSCRCCRRKMRRKKSRCRRGFSFGCCPFFCCLPCRLLSLAAPSASCFSNRGTAEETSSPRGRPATRGKTRRLSGTGPGPPTRP